MPGDLLDVLFDELGKRFPGFRKGAAVVALVSLILIVGFGLYALSSLSVVRESPAPGVRPALERGGSVFESLWSAEIGTIQDLALMRPDRESPVQFLALTGKTVARFDPQGRLLSEIDVHRGTARLIADVQGRLGFFLAASSESYWKWQQMGYVAQAHHLTAIDRARADALDLHPASRQLVLPIRGFVGRGRWRSRCPDPGRRRRAHCLSRHRGSRGVVDAEPVPLMDAG